MIEVSEETALAQIKSLSDLHELLLGYHGRTLRIHKVKSGVTYNHRFDVDGRDRTISDSTGTLVGISSSDLERHRKGRAKNSTIPRLTLALSWGEPISIELGLSLIEVLQEDSGQWKLIHRGSDWEQETTKELKL